MKRLGPPEVLAALAVAPDPFTVALVEGVAAHAGARSTPSWPRPP